METLSGIFITSFLVGLSGAMMPGPVLTVTVGEVTKRGFIAGPLIVLGHGILELSLVIAIVFGIGQILTLNVVVGIIGFAGGLVLLWMGGGMLKSVRGLSLSLEDKGKGKGNHPVVAGVLTSLSNPYWTVWWATIGLSYIALSQKMGAWGLASFYGGHILSDLSWYGLVAATLSMGRRFMTDSIYRGIIAFCGLFLLVFGVYFGYTGLKYLL